MVVPLLSPTFGISNASQPPSPLPLSRPPYPPPFPASPNFPPSLQIHVCLREQNIMGDFVEGSGGLVLQMTLDRRVIVFGRGRVLPENRFPPSGDGLPPEAPAKFGPAAAAAAEAVAVAEVAEAAVAAAAAAAAADEEDEQLALGASRLAVGGGRGGNGGGDEDSSLKPHQSGRQRKT